MLFIIRSVTLLIVATMLYIGIQFMITMPGKSYQGELPTLNAVQRQMQGRLQQHVQVLAGDIGERNMFTYDSLLRAAEYIKETLRNDGYQTQEIAYTLDGKTAANLQVTIPGSVNSHAIVVVGAHYDSVTGSTGANDNATGVAALLELAKYFVDKKPENTLRLVFFVNEEPPFFLSNRMGSRVYAKRAKKAGDNIIAMLSLETLGYYSDEPKSQQYPFPLMFFYPTTANFIGFVANLGSKQLVTRVIKAFREHAQFPSEGIAAPSWIPGVSWSDQWSFWRSGYPAVMVTDTALYRYPHYHSYTDTPDKVDYYRLTLVTVGLLPVVENLLKPTQEPHK